MKISAIPTAATALVGTEIFPLNQGGVTTYATINQIIALMESRANLLEPSSADIGWNGPYGTFATTNTGVSTWGVNYSQLTFGAVTAGPYDVITCETSWAPAVPDSYFLNNPPTVTTVVSYGVTHFAVQPITQPQGYGGLAYAGILTIRLIINGKRTTQSLKLAIGNGNGSGGGYSSIAWAHYAS